MSTLNPDELARARWRISRHSNGQANCVEIACLPELVAVRDSKNRDSRATLALPAVAWTTLLACAQSEGFAANTA